MGIIGDSGTDVGQFLLLIAEFPGIAVKATNKSCKNIQIKLTYKLEIQPCIHIVGDWDPPPENLKFHLTSYCRTTIKVHTFATYEEW